MTRIPVESFDDVHETLVAILSYLDTKRPVEEMHDDDAVCRLMTADVIKAAKMTLNGRREPGKVTA